MSKRFFRSRDTYRDNASSGSRTPEQQQRQVDSLVALGLLGKEEQRPRKREIDRARERSANIDQYLRSSKPSVLDISMQTCAHDPAISSPGSGA
jgi:hypothetical protein